MNQRLGKADLLILFTTLIWGWTFIIVKWSVAKVDPYLFVFCRFLLALILLVVIFHPRIRDNWRACLRPGVFLGVILGLAFITQTLGLKYTTASASGFITGLSVIMVTVFAAIINRRLPRKPVLIGIIAATIGLFLITFKGSLEFSPGDLLTLACAVLFAWHVIYTERLVTKLSVSILTLVQFATVTVLTGLVFLVQGTDPRDLIVFNPWQWAAVLYCGILATAVAYLFQTKAQQEIPTFRTAVLLATEPLFAGIFAIGLKFDPFDWKVVLGGLFILAGMILASWDIKTKPTLPIPELIPIIKKS